MFCQCSDYLPSYIQNENHQCFIDSRRNWNCLAYYVHEYKNHSTSSLSAYRYYVLHLNRQRTYKSFCYVFVGKMKDIDIEVERMFNLSFIFSKLAGNLCY